MSPFAHRTIRLSSINEDTVEIVRPGSPNLLGGLPEGIKREPTPFYTKDRPAIIPSAFQPKFSPSKKRKLGSPRPVQASNPPPIAAPILRDLFAAKHLQQQTRPPPTIQQQQAPKFKSLPALQPRTSDKENGLTFTVSRNAAGPVDPRRPLRRSMRGNTPAPKGMDIHEYRRILSLEEKEKQEKREATSPDELDDDFMDDEDSDDEDFDKVRQLSLPQA